MKEIVILIILLGGNTHKIREKAHADLMKSDICFTCLREYYYDNQDDPEIKLRLKEILWHKFSIENYEKFMGENSYYEANEELMRREFLWMIDIKNRDLN